MTSRGHRADNMRQRLSIDPDELAVAPAAPPANPPRNPRRGPGRPPTNRASTGVGLPVALAEQMADAAAADGVAYGDWLMGALDGVWDDLEVAYPPLPTYRPEVPQPTRPRRRLVRGGRTSVNFRLTGPQLEALDKRQQQLGVESRSEFVTTIVALRLSVLAVDKEVKIR